ncbi:hypothetical protein [Mucilaginibacter celer]|uniref:Uncharacterized protein n=1 Tax=Mucilaginibacter celer TaxID=2305508 RepID=A0A494VWG1_9SPHI|nr:hypothetical protein [Mucilaginibacter celer]AYL98421.1 hypothetical protein HYN43_025450 [Mucilaginibacter celer]
MLNFNNYKLVKGVFILLVLAAVSGCAKKDYRPGYAVGTTFPIINLKGYTLERMQVRVGPRSVVAGYVTEEISGVSYEVPFNPSQDLNRVVFYKEDGSVPYAGSQIRFNTPNRDTTVKIFYDGKTFFQNPVFPAPTAGSMGLRITFKSTASTYKGPVDIELHERYSTTVKVTRVDPKTGKPITVNVDTVLIKPEPAGIIHGVKQTEFNTYTELNPPASPTFVDYAVYIHVANTGNPLPYPTGVVVTPYDLLPFQPDYFALYTITDIRVTAEKPNVITYKVDDRASLFQ